MNGLNLSNIQDAKLGSSQVTALYYGSVKIWENVHDYSQDYLTIESLEDNNAIYWYKTNANLPSLSIEWSSDLNTWTSVTSTTSGTIMTTLNTGDKIYIRSYNSAYATSNSYYHTFKTSNNINVYGNIMSLLYTTNFSNKTTLSSNYIFTGLFRSSKVVDASNLILPATTLTDSCYREMFKGCATLIYPPTLPATTLIDNCYRAMFDTCSALTSAPALPATTLTNYCYGYMFQHCTSLTTAPELPATRLATYCYYYMFRGCTSLTYVKCLATYILANRGLYYWLSNVSSSGTFYKDANTTWPSGSSGIPSGWTVVNV